MNTKTKDDYRDFAITCFCNSSNANQAAKFCRQNNTNVKRQMKHKSIQEAITIAKNAAS